MPDGAVATPAAVRSRSSSAGPSKPRARAFSRDEVVDPHFTLRSHPSRSLGIAAAIAGLGLWLAWGASPWPWLAVPGFWAVANVVEWVTHRYPMHRPMQHRVLYRNHTLVHHRAFEGSDQEIRDVPLGLRPCRWARCGSPLGSPPALDSPPTLDAPLGSPRPSTLLG